MPRRSLLWALPSGFDNACDASACREELRQTIHLVVADALQHHQPATTLRAGSGKVAVTDGPFAETKEHLGGSASSTPRT